MTWADPNKRKEHEGSSVVRGPQHLQSYPGVETEPWGKRSIWRKALAAPCAKENAAQSEPFERSQQSRCSRRWSRTPSSGRFRHATYFATLPDASMVWLPSFPTTFLIKLSRQNTAR